MISGLNVGIIGKNDVLDILINKIDSIFPSENLFITEKYENKLLPLVSYGANICDTDFNLMMRCELIFIASYDRNIASILAPISATTRDKMLICLTESTSVDNILERTAKGTHVVSINWNDENGSRTFSKNTSNLIPKHWAEVLERIFSELQ